MPSERDPLALDPEQMRELGYRVVDLLVDRERRGLPALPRVSREETERRLGGGPPEDPVPTDELLALEREPFLQAVTGHPQSRAAAETVVQERLGSTGNGPGVL